MWVRKCKLLITLFVKDCSQVSHALSASNNDCKTAGCAKDHFLHAMSITVHKLRNVI